MAKKEKRVSINKWESMLCNRDTAISIGDAEPVEINIKHTLPLHDVLEFVEDVCSVCVNTDDGSYSAEIMEFAFKVNVLTRYANFSMPSDVAKQYELVYNTIAYDEVCKYINNRQMDEIYQSIQRNIEYRLSVMASAAVSEVKTLVEKMDTFIDSSNELFGGIDQDGLKAMVDNLTAMSNHDGRDVVRTVLEVKNELAEEQEPSDRDENTNVIKIPHNVSE